MKVGFWASWYVPIPIFLPGPRNGHKSRCFDAYTVTGTDALFAVYFSTGRSSTETLRGKREQEREKEMKRLKTIIYHEGEKTLRSERTK
jgi:hypothetical protein